MSETKIRAPFQFVPFCTKVLIPYRSADELPRHDAILPNLKSGEIHISLRAETPVFVSDGRQYPDNVQRFFRGANGKRMIPGSTLRGLLRENMQILGFGVIRPGEDLEDYQIYYREIAGTSVGSAGSLKKKYHNVLGVNVCKAPGGSSYSEPKNVRIGWLKREDSAEGKPSYSIYPALGELIRVPRSHSDVLQFGEGDARLVSVSYTEANGRAVRIAPRGRETQETMRPGTLLYTGRPVSHPNCLYLFPEMDAASATAEKVSDDDILSYQADLEQRRNSLPKDRVSFWELPARDGESKPVFYLHAEGHIYFGMSRFPRIGYPHSIAEGLPESHRRRIGQLDYPRAILGFAEPQEGGSAYRSRVGVGDLEAVGDPAEGAPVSMILGNPKPSWYPGYTEEGTDYAQDEFRLRGYKQYWLKDTQKTAVKEGKEKVGTTFRPLPIGTEFRGVVRYRNLSEEELGLLLWCLRLEDGCYQTVGMGKPHGYGRVKLTIRALREFNPERLYGADLSATPWDEFRGEQAAQRVERYIKTYDASAGRELKRLYKIKGSSASSMPEIRDFFFIKRAVRDSGDVSYLRLEAMEDGRKINEYTACKNAGQTLPSLEQERTGWEEAQAKAQESAKSMEDLLRELKDKYGER